MYSRLLKPLKDKSFFLFGPRGTGKTSWVKAHFPNALYLDLLASENYTELLANPQRLERHIAPKFKDWIIIDEVQRIPDLLNEVHRLIEAKKYRFILTGSSARKLKKHGSNLLAGRALTKQLYPLTVQELGKDFQLSHSLQYGHLPMVFSESDPHAYLQAYVQTYLREEVLQEGLTRNLAAFSRFLEAASFSQASVLNISEVARECHVERKVVENYFSILEDLLLASRIPVFTKKAKRRMMQSSKFYFFDVGLYRTLRQQGPLDEPEHIEGACLETLFYQELRAQLAYQASDYQLFYWRTANQMEVDFVLYGSKGILAFEVKRSKKIRSDDLRGLLLFQKDYPQAKCYFLSGEAKEFVENGIHFIPFEKALRSIPSFLV